MAKKRIWKPLTDEHKEELVTLLVQANQLAKRTPSMRRLAAYMIKLASWRWTADAVDAAQGIVVLDAIKYDFRYLPHSADAADVFLNYPKELGKRLTHEHCVPLSLIAKEVLNCESEDRKAIRELFNIHCRAALITKDEDRKLNSSGFRSKMPPNWSFSGDIHALYPRYSSVGIELLQPREPF